jgi:Ser/Thr protein kinase RdoA (MazF antagonist)
MRAVDQTWLSSTELDPLPRDLAASAIAQYPALAGARARFVRHGENTTYCVEGVDGVRYALRVHRPGYQTSAAIHSELAWMDSLRDAGIRTPVAVPGADGDLLQHASGPDGVRRSVAVFEWIDGTPLSSIVGLEPWTRLGRLMARVHGHGCAWERPARFERPSCDAEALVGDDPRWGPIDPDGVFAPADREALDAARAEVAARLTAVGQDEDRFGLIHGDLGFENVLVDEDGTVTIIDFDDCGDSWFVHDLAVALYPREGTDGMGERRDALIRGYRTERELPAELLAELPTFLMARRMATLGWVFSRAETGHAQRQRAKRVQTSPAAARQFLTWAAVHPL